MDTDLKFLRGMTEKNYENLIPIKNQKLKTLKSTHKLGLIIGRGDLEQGHDPLPGQTDKSILWIYLDVDFEKIDRQKNQGFSEIPAFWNNADSVEQMSMIENDIFDVIAFDWSVIKFFENLDAIIPILWKIGQSRRFIYTSRRSNGHGVVILCPNSNFR